MIVTLTSHKNVEEDHLKEPIRKTILSNHFPLTYKAFFLPIKVY